MRRDESEVQGEGGKEERGREMEAEMGARIRWRCRSATHFRVVTNVKHWSNDSETLPNELEGAGAPAAGRGSLKLCRCNRSIGSIQSGIGLN